MKQNILYSIVFAALIGLLYHPPASGAAIRSVLNNSQCLVTVNIEAAPESTAESWAVEEYIYGLRPDTITQNGVYDSVHGTIRWGTFEDALARTLSYTLKDADFTISPNGVMSVNGIDEPITGATEATVACTPPKAEKPEFTPPSGTEAPVNVSISSQTDGANIFYTSDGAVPDTGSALYAGNLEVTDGVFIRAVAAKSGYRTSDVSSALYRQKRNQTASIAVSIINAASCFPEIRLNITPAAGTLSWVVEAKIPSGLIPSAISHQGVWDEPKRMIRWGEFVDATPLELSFQADGEDGGHTLDITGAFNGLEEEYSPEVTIICPRASAPVFDPPSGTEAPVDVAITTATSGAGIHYTTDGSTPDASDALYSGPVSLSANTVLKAIAIKDGLASSRVSAATYPSGLPKAIIVAGGGPYDGNFLWDATLKCAVHAYRAMRYKGYTKNQIQFLSDHTFLDADDDGLYDDVDDTHTIANLETAITSWALTAGSLLLYITDHGGDGTFRMNENEILTAGELNGWLDTLQQTMTGDLVIVYDACRSGTFISSLTPPAGKSRIIITSASDESAYFLKGGAHSFSYQFFASIFGGSKLKDAYLFARDMMGAHQTPLVETDGDGLYTNPDVKFMPNLVIGREISTAADRPLVTAVSEPVNLFGPTHADFWADIISLDAIVRTWAVIQPPPGSGSSDIPVMILDEVDMTHSSGDRYTGTYDDFTQTGQYTVSIFAEDELGNFSKPGLVYITQNGDKQLQKGDLNMDGYVRLDDAVIALKVLAGMDVSPVPVAQALAGGADVDGDSAAGIEEVVYILGFVAGVR